MKIIANNNIDQISASDWNALVKDRNPFMSHEFLLALERHNCASQKFGWYPMHITSYDENKLVAASPLYLKTNSYGELVFDSSWANAYKQSGRSYYPKLVCAVPYTPATGQRILARTSENSLELIKSTINKAQEENVSSIHWLFPDSQDFNKLSEIGLISRKDIQFHWKNRNYESFNDFLNMLTSRKRKMIKKERRKIKDADFEFEVIHGTESNREHWNYFQDFYESTFKEKYGIATLNQPFFEEIADTLGDSVILILVKQYNKYVAGSLFFRSNNRLYGRHWGTLVKSNGLHFETCYYQGIDYCIKHKLEVFEPGAQGEYKFSRGFMPVITRSAHWIADKYFRQIIEEHTSHEKKSVSNYLDSLMEQSPFHK